MAEIEGLSVKVIPEDHLHALPIVVAMCEADVQPENRRADNVRTNCEGCGEPVVHRPDIPPEPAKICLPCALERLGPEVLFRNVATTNTQLRELRAAGVDVSGDQ